MKNIKVDELATWVANVILKEDFEEKGRQDSVAARLDRDDLRAPRDNPTKKEEDEEVEVEEEIEVSDDEKSSEKEQGELGKELGGKNFKADVPDEPPASIKYGDIVKQLNAMRAGKSPTKNKEIKQQLQDYLKGMGEGERQALFSYLSGLAAVLTGATSGEDAPSPAKGEFEQEIEPVDAEQEELSVQAKTIVKKKEDIPIVVGESSQKAKELMVVLENLDSSSHLCMMGNVVPFGSDECIIDLERRINDASQNRDSCSRQSEDRIYYNGLLKMLRKKLRAALKSAL